MMHLTRAFLFLGLFCLSGQLFGQKTTVYTEANLAYKRGEDFFNKGIYGYAMEEFRQAIEKLPAANEPQWEQLKMRAELGYAKSAVRLEKPDGEKLILDFIRKYSPDPLASQALMEVANYFYNARKYDKALDFYKEINPRGLNQLQRAEVYFKTGYCYFVQKQFREAEANFVQIKDAPGNYFYPANYYYGLCQFFQTKYSEAIKAFRLAERSQEYKPHVPYYIAQIYFAQRDFEELIKYSLPKLNDRKLRKLEEMNRLVGQAYFEQGKYDQALTYLEAGVTRQMQEQDFYQLGYCQYRAGRYGDAAENFQQLTSVNSEMGQLALYYLADCRLKLKDKEAARNAFAAASRMSYKPEIQEVSMINYAKLSYELKFDKEALTALQSIQPSSIYYNEAQVLMSDIFVNTRNYDEAIKTLEGMPNKTPQLKEAYQQVLYLRGVQHHRDGRLTQAKEMFTKSVANSVDARFKALSLYWLGDIQYQEKNYDTSIDYLNQFIALSKSQRGLPDESSIYTANYLQGYNYLKKQNFNTAEKYFSDAVEGIRRNSSFIVNKTVKESILGDATLRAGDCLFKRNKYNDAIKFYDAAVNARYPGFEYALFQKAIIEGLRGRNTDKIIALESLIERHSQSAYADDALFQLGITFQEIKQAGKATDSFMKLVGDYPNSDLVNDALLRLGLVAYNQGNRPAAIEFYKKVFSHNPNKGEADAALTALREIYIKDMGDPDGYTAFLETVPGYSLENSEKDQLAFDAAENAYENGQYEKAITAFTSYLNRYPNGINTLVARYHRGESYAVLQQYSKALEDYEWILAKGRGRYYVDALGKAAQIAYHNEQDFQKAYDLYMKWENETTIPEDRFEAQLGAMRSAYRLNNVAAVQSAARKVATNAAASDLQKATAEFYLGKIAFDKKDFATAMTSFNKVTKLSDNEQTAEARYLIAEIHYQNRDLDKAKKQCLDNNNENSGYPYWVGKSLLLLSDVFAEQGDTFSAKTVLEALIQNYENQTDEIVPTARKKLEVLKKQEAGKSRIDTGNNFMDDGNNN